MHIEKSTWDNLVVTLLNIEWKNKDTTNTCLDLEDLNIWKEPYLQKVGDKVVKSHTAYILTTHHKVAFYKFLKSIKFTY